MLGQLQKVNDRNFFNNLLMISLSLFLVSEQVVLGSELDSLNLLSAKTAIHSNEIRVLKSLGTVTKEFEGKNRVSHPLILIRDVHAQPEVQNNISEILKNLNQQY